MAYYLDIYTPETYEGFLKSPRDISGSRRSRAKFAQKIKPGDKLICYMTELSRWIGTLEVLSESFIDDTPLYFEKNDPFVVRFKIKPLVFLPIEQTIPIHEDFIWNQLSFTKGKHGSNWTGLFLGNLNRLSEVDGMFLETVLLTQAKEGREYPFDEAKYRKWLKR